MQFLGRLLDTVSSVSTLFTNPYRVREVSLSDYAGGGKVMLREEGRMVLYKNSQCQSWDCLLMCPETPPVTLRLVHARIKKQILGASPVTHMFVLDELGQVHSEKQALIVS